MWTSTHTTQFQTLVGLIPIVFWSSRVTECSPRQFDTGFRFGSGDDQKHLLQNNLVSVQVTKRHDGH